MGAGGGGNGLESNRKAVLFSSLFKNFKDNVGRWNGCRIIYPTDVRRI